MNKTRELYNRSRLTDLYVEYLRNQIDYIQRFFEYESLSEDIKGTKRNETYHLSAISESLRMLNQFLMRKELLRLNEYDDEDSLWEERFYKGFQRSRNYLYGESLEENIEFLQNELAAHKKEQTCIKKHE